MAGYEVVKVGTDARGNVDLDDLRAKADEDVACLMLTNPSTLGLFETGIEEIARIVHGVGATLYYDGANLNAIMGICRPGDMGFDIVHFNLHKSFTPAARRRRPRRRPGRGVGADRALPAPAAGRPSRVDHERVRAVLDLDYDRPEVDRAPARVPGQLRGVRPLLRVHPLARRGGAARGLGDRRSQRQLPPCASCERAGVAEYLPVAYDRLCMHEFVLSGEPMRRELQIKTLDLAKRLLDHGVHPPTVYFPLVVEEALMVEPTETETKETLDRFAEIVAEILEEAREDPEIARSGAVHDAGQTPGRGRRGAPPGRPAGDAGVARRMRFIVFGAGAIGGVVGAKLHQSGFEVALIARGAHYERDPRAWPDASSSRTERAVLQIPVADSPDGLDWGGEEVVMLTTKSQDTAAALDTLRGAAPASTPVVCPAERRRERADRPAAVRERLRRGGDVPDRAPRARDRPGLRDPGTGVIDVGALSERARRAVRGDRGRAGASRLQLDGAAGHHALQVRQAARQPGQRRRRDLRAGRRRRRADRARARRRASAALRRRRDRVRRRRRQRRRNPLGAPRPEADRRPRARRLLDPPEHRSRRRRPSRPTT